MSKTLCEDYNCIFNITNHKMKVEDNGKIIVLKNMKANPRTEYDYKRVDDSTWELEAVVSGIKDLPPKFQGKQLVVSRETLRAVNELEANILKKYDLWGWLIRYKQIRELESQEDFNIKDKLHKINSKNTERVWPDFYYWVNDNIPTEEHEDFYVNLKRYVGRDDLLSPGPRTKDADGNVVACKGLMTIKSFWDGVLW